MARTLKQIKRVWSKCHVCADIKIPCNHVFYRGVKNCDIFFIGEAPGFNEDMCGIPFVGRAGQLLDRMLMKVKEAYGPFTIGITNILACFPTDENDKTRQPTKEEANACRPRFLETLEWSNPKSICLLGKSAKKHTKLPKEYRELPLIELYHPAYVLRKGGINSLEAKRSILYLTDFLTTIHREHHAKKED